MSFPLWAKFLWVSLLLRLAAAWAGLFREGLRGRALGHGDYASGLASARFGFEGPFDYDTVLEVPRGERYPWRIAVPKLLVVSALRTPLQEAYGRRFRRIAEVDALHGVLGRPLLRKLDFASDAVFGRLRVQGPNPLWIEARGEGYQVDYRELLRGLPTRPGRWLAPCAAFFDGALMPVQIELLVEGEPQRFTPDDGDHWKLARLFFQAADLFVHEAVSHLSWTHLHAEGVILAAARTLSPRHPMRVLLGPAFSFTLQANSNSGKVLMGSHGVFDRAFSAGWEGTSMLMARAEAWWRFSRMIPVLDASARGMDSLADYPWRDDADLLWKATLAHAQRATSKRWPDADAIARDTELVAFLQALSQRHADRGWPVGTDPATLATVTAALLFLTVRHTLVNAQQYAMFGHPPAWPASIAVPPPVRGRSLAPDILVGALPDVGQTLDTLRATYAFSIQFNRLGAGAGDPELARELAAVERILAQRDAKRPWPYRVARPSLVSGSINA